MRRVVFMSAALLALVLAIALFAPQAEASKFGPGMASMVSLASLGSADHMATGGGDLRQFLEWLKFKLIKYFGYGGSGGFGGSGGSGGSYTPKNSVPIPGTLLLFGGGFAGFIFWSARQPQA